MSDNRNAGAATARPNFRRAMEAYARGENVTKHLQREMQTDGNTPAIIEMAYDLQAGTYIDWVKQNADLAARRTAEAADILGPHLLDGDTLLDVGTGELTTFSALAAKLKTRLSALYAFDIGWSRVHCGLGFAAQALSPELLSKLTAFVADIGATPFRTKSVDVTISNHALEPNGGHEKEILSELLRITRRKLVLFEPSYANNSEQGRQRMERLGYIRDLDRHAWELGATVEDVRPLKNIDNPENPTVAYVIVPAGAEAKPAGVPAAFADPGTDNPLVKFDSCYFSPERGVSYPVIEGIPVFRSEAAVLTSALSKKC
jgi:hypothetical protein